MEIPEDLGRLRGFVQNDDGGWMLPGFKTVLVDGHYVPAQHEGLYRRILESHGHLVCGPSLVGLPELLMRGVKMIMDMIADIESVRDTELSRVLLDDWFGSLRFMGMFDFSVRWLRWLKPQVEELDRKFRRLEFIAEFRRADPELADRMEVVAGFAKARDEEKEIQTAMAANT